MVSGGAGGVTLDAAGAITGGSGNSISGDTINLTGTEIGTSTATVNTAQAIAPVAFLDITSTASSGGGVYLTHTGTLNLTASAASGPVNMAATGSMTVASVSGAGVTLSTGGTSF